MTPQKRFRFDLKFALGSRTVFAVPLTVVRHEAFLQGGRGYLQACVSSLTGSELHLFLSIEGDPAGLSSCVEGRFLVHTIQAYRRFRTDLSGSFEQLLGELSSRRRSTLLRKVRRFERESGGVIDWRTYTTGDAMREFIALAGPLAAKTYQAKRFDGALPSDDAFREEAVQSACDGHARGYLLFLHDAPMAYLYTPQRGDSLIYAYLGYDAEYSALSPGIVLQYLVHQSLFDEKPCRYFDFTQGEGDHKQLFANESSECCDLLLTPRGLRWRALLASHRYWDSVVERLRMVAQRMGLLSRMKRWLK